MPTSNSPRLGHPIPSPESQNIGTLTSFNLQSNKSPYEVHVSEPQKHGEGMKDAFVSYLITSRDIAHGINLSVRRRFTDFVWLHNQLCNVYPAAIVCPLPDKHRMGR
jgi:sorting nexin-4